MKNISAIVASLVTITYSFAFAQTNVVKDKVDDIYYPAPFSQQHLDGLLGERMQVSIEKRLLKVDEQGIIGGFQKRPGVQPWIGEHAGKFLHAASNAYEYSHNEELKTLLDRVAKELMACQMDDGYLGTYTDDKRWVSWDVWVHKYDLIGLLRYYDLTGDKQALDVSKKIGDLLWKTFGDGEQGTSKGKDISLAGEHLGMAATSVLEPMCYLYRHTGDQKYLDFCFYITRSMEQHSKLISNLTQTKRVYGTANNKAYEMLSNLVGLCELYRLTGDKTFLIPAQNAWQDVVDHRLYVTGTASTHEHFADDNDLPAGDGDDIGEGCVTVTWMQLNLELLRLSGDAKYAEQMERSIYNHLLGAMNTDDGDVCYYMALVGDKHPTPGINCCVSSVPRGIALIPSIVWGRRGDGIAVNLYNAGKATIPLNGTNIEITTKTNLPHDGKVELTLQSDSPKKFPLYLRVPKWAGDVSIPDSSEEANYRKIEVDTAKPVTLSFDFEPRVAMLDGGQNYPKSVGLQRGPQIYCFDAESAKDVPLPAFAAFADASPKLEATDDATAFHVNAIIDEINPVTGQFNKESKSLTLIPFADSKSPRVWLPSADTLPTGPAPVTFGGKESQSRGGSNPAEGPFTDLRTDTYRSTRNGKTADEDWFAVELLKPAKIARVVYGHGNGRMNGGWFDTSKSKPRIEYKETAEGDWKTLGTLEDYPATTPSEAPPIPNGQPFELKLKEPVTAAAIRVVGAPSGGYKKNVRFSTSAELQAYAN